jgi:hypothetical protein
MKISGIKKIPYIASSAPRMRARSPIWRLSPEQSSQAQLRFDGATDLYAPEKSMPEAGGGLFVKKLARTACS